MFWCEIYNILFSCEGDKVLTDFRICISVPLKFNIVSNDHGRTQKCYFRVSACKTNFTNHHTPDTIHSFRNSFRVCKMNGRYCTIRENFEHFHSFPSRSSNGTQSMCSSQFQPLFIVVLQFVNKLPSQHWTKRPKIVPRYSNRLKTDYQTYLKQPVFMRKYICTLWANISCAMLSQPYLDNFVRSSRLQMFFVISVLENFSNFTLKHLWWNSFLIKLQPWRLAILLKRNSDKGVFTWILWYF